MNVAGKVNQVRLPVHMLGFEGALKEGPYTILLAVDGFGVGDAERLHDSFAERIRLETNEQMVMRWHQAIGNDADQIRLAIVTQAFDEKAPVCFLEKDGLAVHASIVEVVVVSGAKLDFAHGLLLFQTRVALETRFLTKTWFLYRSKKPGFSCAECRVVSQNIHSQPT
jgi:hypothetical protein